ncbi:MAG: cell division protein FtsL [Aquabacterium sp.]
MNLRVNALLLVALVATGLLLVRTAYDTRRLYADFERAKDLEQRLAGEYKRLEAEARGAATHLRVEKEARARLQMRPATPAVTHVVVDTAPADPARNKPSPTQRRGGVVEAGAAAASGASP